MGAQLADAEILLKNVIYFTRRICIQRYREIIKDKFIFPQIIRNGATLSQNISIIFNTLVI